jgi:hypothetical protein
MQPGKVANSDAKALARYLQGLGIEVTADRLNDLLVLLAVVMIEGGGGLSLAIGMALSASATGFRATPAARLVRTTGQAPLPAPVPDAPMNASYVAPDASVPPVVRTVVSSGPVVQLSDVAAWLRARGGRTHTTMRRLG